MCGGDWVWNQGSLDVWPQLGKWGQWGGREGGRERRQLAEQRVSVTGSECDSHTGSFVPTQLCPSQRVDV